MSCDFDALTSIDSSDPDQLDALMQQCTSVIFSPQLWLWTIVFTVVGAVVGAMIGKRKNTMARDAMLGAALGPIGWIISLYLPAPKKPTVCPACKKIVDPKDAHCKYCGAKIPKISAS
ncbi:MAG: zinc ribbon domain-containing protein [Rudaea sp.]